MKSGIYMVIVALGSGCALSPASNPPTEAPGVSTTADSTAQLAVVVKEPLPNFSGRWVLNEKVSDDPRAKVKDAMKSMKRPRGPSQTGGVGGGRGGGGKKGGRGHAAMDPAGQGRGVQLGDVDYPSMSKTLDIAQADPRVLITDEDGRVQQIYSDLRGSSISASGSLQQRVTTAGWERGALVVESTANNGQRLIQTYSLKADPRQLVVLAEITIPQLDDPIQVRQVYDPLPTSP